jgi:hypothetical protein
MFQRSKPTFSFLGFTRNAPSKFNTCGVPITSSFSWCFKPLPFVICYRPQVSSLGHKAFFLCFIVCLAAISAM